MPRKKHPGGRPTKYKPEYCQDLIDYFRVPRPDPANPQSMAYFPTLDGWCCTIGITRQTISDWVKVHPEFSHSYDISQQLGRNQLMHGGLSEKYNASFAKFVGVNLGMISEHTKTESKVDANVNVTGININFVDKKKEGE